MSGGSSDFQMIFFKTFFFLFFNRAKLHKPTSGGCVWGGGLMWHPASAVRCYNQRGLRRGGGGVCHESSPDVACMYVCMFGHTRACVYNTARDAVGAQPLFSMSAGTKGGGAGWDQHVNGSLGSLQSTSA